MFVYNFLINTKKYIYNYILQHKLNINVDVNDVITFNKTFKRIFKIKLLLKDLKKFNHELFDVLLSTYVVYDSFTKVSSYCVIYD